MKTKLRIAYLYPQELNLYGDTGNIEILYQRARQRGIDAEVTMIDSGDKVTEETFKQVEIVFMGGGPDAGQKQMYQDLLENKGPYLKDYLTGGGIGLFVCGSYQLLGRYYKAYDGSVLEGLGIFDMYTQHFGHLKSRCVGNIVCRLEQEITGDNYFKMCHPFSDKLVGFENHGGQTFLGENVLPMATVLNGNGNNTSDKTEGLHFNNAFGTYLHGPILSKNPFFADYLIAKSLKLEKISNLDNNIIIKAHSALLKRFG